MSVPGVVGSVIPLEPPTYLEMVTVADRRSGEAAERIAKVLGRMRFVEVGGDPEQLATWIGSVDVDVRYVGGEARLAAVGISTANGEIVLR